MNLAANERLRSVDSLRGLARVLMADCRGYLPLAPLPR